MKFIACHPVALITAASMAFGLGGGGYNLYRIHQYEAGHVSVQTKGGNHGHGGGR